MSRRPLDVTVVSLLLRLYPRRFREQLGPELLESYRRRRRSRAFRAFAATVLDLLIQAPLARLDERRRKAPRPRPEEKVMHGLLHELRLAARTLFARQVTFTALCVLTLALGLGATTAIFSVVHGVLLAPLPYGEPERIVLLHQMKYSKAWGHFAGANFSDLRQRLESFEVMAAYDDYRPEGVDLTAVEPVERVRSLRVGAGYFEALGVTPLVGRTFRREEEIPPGAAARDPEAFAMTTEPANPVVILSNGLWRRLFGGDRDVLGRRLELDRRAYTVVGVMPAGLGGHAGGSVDLWLPLDLAPGGQNVRANNYLSVVARLAPGVDFGSARAELEQAGELLREEHPDVNGHLSLTAMPLEEAVVGPSRTLLGLLFAAVAAMLAIACLNVANLFLTRGLARRRELGLRAALGAGRGRLFAQTLIEGLWIGVAGGVLGLGLAWLAVRGLLALRPEALPRYDALGLHWPVLLFCLAAVLATVLVFALQPALGAARADARAPLGVRGGLARGTRRDRRLRDFAVSLQVALALVLVASGGLLTQSFLTLHGTDLGFDPERALTFQMRLPDYAYAEGETRIDFYRRLFTRLDGLPDVAASGATSKLPASGHRNHWGFGIEGRDHGDDYPQAEIRCVAGRVFDALGMPLLAGRAPGASDLPGAERVVVVNRALADRYFPDGDALGARLRVGGPPARVVVGIVGDARHDPRQDAVPKIYVPQPQFADDRNWDLSFAVARAPGTDTPWPALRRQVEAVVADLDPRLVVYDTKTMAEVAAEPIARQRFGAFLMIVFAAVSLLLAAVGLFGALAYSLGQRRGELGVRMALGADRRRVLAAVLVHGLRLFATGALLGLAGVWASGRWLESLLYEVEVGDPRVVLFSLVVLFVAAAVAAAWPARRAVRLDPAQILRES